MALAIRKRVAVKPSSSGAPKQPEKLTIEQARERYELGTIPRAVAECLEFQSFKDKARELTNESNRAKTQAGKAVNALVLNETIGKGDKLFIGDQVFSYDYATSESLPTEEFFKLYESGKISRDIFLRCISVGKDMAVKLVGAHIIDDLLVTKIGNKADMRIEQLDKPIDEPYKIVRKPPPVAKVAKKQHEPVVRATGVTRKPMRRTIKVVR